jgi:hypothetical protein
MPGSRAFAISRLAFKRMISLKLTVSGQVIVFVGEVYKAPGLTEAPIRAVRDGLLG